MSNAEIELTTTEKTETAFYFTFALLLASRKYVNDLIESKDVGYGLKRALRIISNRITDMEKEAIRSLDTEDAKKWKKEWSDRDYEMFANIFTLMTHMDEERRNVLEMFTEQLAAGNVEVDYKK